MEMETIVREELDHSRNYRFRIDWNKWKVALDKVLAEREKGRYAVSTDAEKKYWASLQHRYDEKLTILYSIRAQARGRTHRQYAVLNEYEWRKLGHKTPGWQEFTANNGTIRFVLTLDDQAAYIGDAWKEFEKIKTEPSIN